MKYSDNLIKHGSQMFLAVTILNILNLLYQLYMARNLSPSNYGILNSLFSVLMIVSIPSGTVQTVVTKFISTFYINKHYERINLLLCSFAKKVFFFGLFIFLLIMFVIYGLIVLLEFLEYNY